MQLGLATERDTMRLAISNIAKAACPSAADWELEHPSVFRSTSPALCCSPDGVVKIPERGGSLYMEAKSSSTVKPTREARKKFKEAHEHQMQLNMMLGGYPKGVLALWDTSDGQSQPTAATVSHFCYRANRRWQSEFMIRF
jgi:hypothetical protein